VDALTALRRAPATTALFLDYDGTLAPIVANADEARPLPGVSDLLLELQRSFGVVAVVSGRPVDYLRQHLPSAVELHGLYGLETVVDGQLSHHPEAEGWRSVVDDVDHDARQNGPAGVDVEHKGLSLTLHYRRRPEVAPGASTWAAEAAARTGLRLRRAKMSIELHPPVGVDKGTVVETRSAGMTAACYIGDDEGDLPAFAALDRLARQGLATLKVAVRTQESAAELVAQADLEVDGPEGAVALLRGLLDAP
jgi:trehalose 6-phosphate phosphatase